MGGAGGARPRTWFAWFGAKCVSRGYFGGFAPLPSGAACPADSPRYTLGRMARDSFFPLETYRPALRAGVGEFGGRGSAAFGATGDSGAYCKLSGESEAFRLRHAGTRKRQFAPPMRTKAFFFGAPHPFLWARPKKWGHKFLLYLIMGHPFRDEGRMTSL